MKLENLLTSESDGVFTITLNRPERRNAITPKMLVELRQVLLEVADMSFVRVLVIGAAGKAFCSGADLVPGDFPTRETLQASTELYNLIEDFPHPVVCAVQGPAVAGGFELVLACDIVLAAESATMSDIHANVGLLPGAGGAYRLVQRLGLNRAKHMMFTGDFFSAQQLADFGLVTAVFPDDSFITSVDKFAQKLAAKSPLGLAAMKRLANSAVRQDRDTAMAAALLENSRHATTKDYNEGLKAMAERRVPLYIGE